MRVLVTGGTGFAGRHAVAELARHGHEVVLFDLEDPRSPVESAETIFTGDIRDPDLVAKVIKDSSPDACIHLAGIAFIPLGDDSPDLVYSVNMLGTMNLLEACRKISPGTRILTVASAFIYAQPERDIPLTEDSPLGPTNVYELSKAAADQASLSYAHQYGMPVMTARPSNHIGPDQARDFVVPSFASQVKAIAAGHQKPLMNVGNLNSECCFSDVRDAVRAYRLIIEAGEPGQAYNVCASKRLRIGDILDQLCKIAGIRPKIAIDPEKFRPSTIRPILDTRKIRDTTGWSETIDITTTLRDILKQL